MNFKTNFIYACNLFLSRHKNSVVRKVAAQHMVTLCEKLGPGRLLSGVKDITDRVLPTVASLSTDASPETRYVDNVNIAVSAERHIMVLHELNDHPDINALSCDVMGVWVVPVY